MIDIQKFNLEEQPIEQSAVDWFKEKYGIDITKLSIELQNLLVNFRAFGSSEAIMSLISKLQKE